MSKKDKNNGDPKAADLLPPDAPAPIAAGSVMPSDASLLGEVDTRKIGIRRVSCLNFANRFLKRARWRPAGNSRSFWKKIETDDPFLRPPAMPTDAVLEIYPSQRLARMEGSLPKPQPDIAKAYTPRPESQPAPVRARQEVKRPPKRPAPEPRHTPEPRPAPSPTKQPEPVQEVERPTPPKKIPPAQRRLPPKPQNTQRSRTGRQRMPSRAKPPKPTAPPQAPRSAKEIREQKARDRAGGPTEVKKSLDTYREFMQDMMFMRDKFDAGEEIPQIIDETADKEVRRPKPKGEATRRSKTEETKKPTPAPKPVDRTPPRTAKKKPKEIDRSIKKGGNSGGLNDLFGGGGDRVRIGRRSKPDAGGEPES